MKEMLFKDRATGAVKRVACSENTSNIEATRKFRDTNGKSWGLVMSRQQIPEKK